MLTIFSPFTVGIILRLSKPKLVIFAAFIADQFIMRALLDDTPAVKYYYTVAETAGGQPVADIYCSLIFNDIVKS